MRLVEQAQQSKSRTQILADRAAGWLFYIALGVAAAHRGRLDRRRRASTSRCSSGWPRCWSSPARTRWGWPSRWWWRSPPRMAAQQRHPGARPAGAGSGARDRHGHLRQDRHADQGRVRRGRHGRGRRLGRGRGPGAGRGGRRRLRAHHRAGHPPGSRGDAGWRCRRSPASRRSRAAACAPPATASTVYVGGPRLLEMLGAALPDRLWPASPQTPATRARAVVYLVAGRARLPPPSPWPT